MEGLSTDLRGKTAIVTGATSGIGEVCARELAGMGATVVLAVRSASKAQATLARIKESHPDADVVVGPLIDMMDSDSIRAFAADYVRQGRPLHILVNNAGAYTNTRKHTKEGVAELCQVNHLGPYLLTRLLEGVLVKSAPARVVTVASVTHRMGLVGADPKRDFIKGDYGHFYWNTKFANVLFAYELQRRLAKHGVRSCAVDPGSVHTDVWRDLNWVIRRGVEFFYAPPDVGALPLLYGALCPWATGEPAVGDVDLKLYPAEHDLRYYAPEAFALPLISWYGPEGNWGTVGCKLMHWFGLPFTTPWGAAKHSAWFLSLLGVSLVDWPLRQLSKGKLLQNVKLVPSSPPTYDAELASALWNASADVAGVPREFTGSTGVSKAGQ